MNRIFIESSDINITIKNATIRNATRGRPTSELKQCHHCRYGMLSIPDETVHQLTFICDSESRSILNL